MEREALPVGVDGVLSGGCAINLHLICSGCAGTLSVGFAGRVVWGFEKMDGWQVDARSVSRKGIRGCVRDERNMGGLLMCEIIFVEEIESTRQVD